MDPVVRTRLLRSLDDVVEALHSERLGHISKGLFNP